MLSFLTANDPKSIQKLSKRHRKAIKSLFLKPWRLVSGMGDDASLASMPQPVASAPCGITITSRKSNLASRGPGGHRHRHHDGLLGLTQGPTRQALSVPAMAGMFWT